tara:strand:+ start:149 stop:346 length:198 start_codon:yes stop_codon:yes gene_type:complete
MDFIKPILFWLIISISLVYLDMNTNNKQPLSDCHGSPVYWYYDYKEKKERPMCVQCKLFCEVKKR